MCFSYFYKFLTLGIPFLITLLTSGTPFGIQKNLMLSSSWTFSSSAGHEEELGPLAKNCRWTLLTQLTDRF